MCGAHPPSCLARDLSHEVVADAVLQDHLAVAVVALPGGLGRGQGIARRARRLLAAHANPQDRRGDEGDAKPHIAGLHQAAVGRQGEVRGP